MCTILYLYRVHPQYPLVVAANRDEFYAREASGPRVLSEAPRSVGGVDLRANGTWMGCNDRGLMVGLTNQRTARPLDPTLHSRGDVVRNALGAGTPAEVTAQLEALRPAAYNPFNLLYGTGDELLAAYARPDRECIEIEPAPEGIHALPNDRIGASGFPKADRAVALAREVATLPWTELQPALASIVRDHEAAICSHGEAYGTCSSTIMALTESTVAHYLFAEGPPCESAFVERTALLGGAG